MTTLHSLADLAIRVLDAQKTYFKTRSTTDLILAKGLEKELMEKSSSVLERPYPQPVEPLSS